METQKEEVLFYKHRGCVNDLVFMITFEARTTASYLAGPHVLEYAK